MTPFVSALLQTAVIAGSSGLGAAATKKPSVGAAIGAVLGSAIVLIPAYSASEKQVGTSGARILRFP